MSKTLTMYKIAVAKWKELLMAGELSPRSVSRIKQTGLLPSSASEYLQKMVGGLQRKLPNIKIFRIGSKEDIERLKQYLKNQYIHKAVGDIIENARRTGRPLARRDIKRYILQAQEDGERYAIEKIKNLKNTGGMMIPGELLGRHTIIVVPKEGKAPLIVPKKRKLTSFDSNFALLHELAEASLKNTLSRFFTHKSPKVLGIEKSKIEELARLYPEEVKRLLQSRETKRILKIRFHREYPVMEYLKANKKDVPPLAQIMPFKQVAKSPKARRVFAGALQQGYTPEDIVGLYPPGLFANPIKKIAPGEVVTQTREKVLQKTAPVLRELFGG